jgi:hypothetical protein
MTDLDFEDLKYGRYGYSNLGSKTDNLLEVLTKAIPGDGVLPKHWQFRSKDNYTTKYSKLGHILWSKSTNCHTLMIGTNFVLRFWTYSKDGTWIDLNDQLVSILQHTTFSKVVPIPEGTWRKSKPLTKRIRVWQQFHILEVANAVKRIYGLGNTTV